MTCRSFEGQRKGGRGGRGGGNGKGRSTSLGAEEKQGTQRECHVACSPPRYSLSLPLSPSRAVYVGRQEWRQEATPPPSSLHPLLPSFSSLLTPHVFPALPPPFPLSYSTSLSAPLLSLLRAKFLFVNCLFFSFHPLLSLCLSSSPTGVPVHHNSLGVEVC